MGGFNKAGQRGELPFPECAVVTQPCFRRDKGRRGQAAGAHAAGLDGVEDPGPLEHVHVLEEGGQRHRVLGGERRHRGIPHRQLCDDGAPHGIGEGRERAIESQ